MSRAQLRAATALGAVSASDAEEARELARLREDLERRLDEHKHQVRVAIAARHVPNWLHRQNAQLGRELAAWEAAAAQFFQRTEAHGKEPPA